MAVASALALGGLAVGGAVLNAKSQKKAAKNAAAISQQTADTNNALARDMYAQNAMRLDPFAARGNVAGDQINALLGLGGGAFPPAASPAPANALQGFYSGANPGAAPMPGQPGMGATGGVSPQQAQRNAFDTFRNSTGYQFRLGEGMNALNSGYAGAGILQSGAAMRAAQEYGQNFASNEFGNYMNMLGNQQGIGLGGASALAGVGQNMVGQVSANNNNAGTNAANAALIRGQNNPFAAGLGALSGFGMGMFG